MLSKKLTIKQAAKYIKLDESELIALSQSGKIPAIKNGKEFIYDETTLKKWVKLNKLLNFFIKTDFNIQDNEALREPQRDGYLAAYDFFKKGGKEAIIQIPVGCGKSGLASLLPLGIAAGRVLMIAPNITIRGELFDTCDITNRQKCFWRRMRVLEEKDMKLGPLACNLEEGNISVCEECHIVITNIQQLATNTEKWLKKFPDNFFDMIIVDEGHHSAATSWKKVFEKFPTAKIINLTATPFRSDRQKLGGELVYRYPFKNASIKGYIKKLRASYVAPSELTFTDKGKTKTYSLQEVLKMKDEEWFSKGVALSEPCNISIVDNSLEKLEKLRQSGTGHQIIAVACSIHHAQQIRALYSERGYVAEVIHSYLKEEEKGRIIRDLKNGTLDCIVQVQMLGEGFDHQKLSVAAIFNPFRSLAPYIQFVGRILRVIVQNDSIHPDNYGYIVTHVGLNLDQQLKKFKEFENDDQSFWEEMTSGEVEPAIPQEILDGKKRQRVGERMVVSKEIVDTLFEEDFAAVEDKDIIAELESKFKSLGIDPALAKQVFEQHKASQSDNPKAPAAQPFSIQPQRQWKEARKRLNEEVNRTAKLVLNTCDLPMQGTDIPYKLKLGSSARSNFIASIELVNKLVSELCPGKKSREEWTIDEFKLGIAELPKIKDRLVRKIKKSQDVEAQR